MMKNKENLQINIAVLRMGSVTKKPEPCSFTLRAVPHTFRELIEEAVRTCVEAYRARAAQAKEPAPLTDAQFSAMTEVGKFAFGVHYNENEIDTDRAVQTALKAVTDGLVRVFKGNEELRALDDALNVSPGDVFTFVRITMLSGRMW